MAKSYFARKRTRDDSAGRVRQLVEAADVSTLREALGLSQAQLAAQLGVSRRTIIRGELRGMEIPFRPDSTRSSVYEAWNQLSDLAHKRKK
jgi:ribosome-binding protein aMBF1 (putative translation factor)